MIEARTIKELVAAANGFARQNRFPEAIDLLDEAIGQNPNLARLHARKGHYLNRLKRYTEAVQVLDKALELNPELVTAHLHRARSLGHLGNLEEAIENARRATDIKPDFAVAYGLIGKLHHFLGQFDEAIACFDKALGIQPELVDSNIDRGILRLLKGEHARGWQDYDQRWSMPSFKAKNKRYIHSNRAVWRGENLEGKSILLFPEQGLGDAMQYVRFAPYLAAQGALVSVATLPRLHDLFLSVNGVSRFVRSSEPLGRHDYHVSLMDIPFCMDEKRLSIPVYEPYLSANPALRDAWRKRIGRTKKYRVGLVWAGSSTKANDHWRSIDPSYFHSLAKIGNVKLYSLQVSRKQDSHPTFGAKITDLAADLITFSDTASAISHLDLVISVDTSVAHLAGALGKPVWTLLQFVPDWRWGLETDKTDWYPTMKLYRQPARGDWRSVLETVKTDLTQLAAK